MKLNSNITTGFLCLFIITAVVTGGLHQKYAQAKKYSRSIGPVQTAYTAAGAVFVSPEWTAHPGSVNNLLAVRISLQSNKPIRQPGLMSYMNFGIKNAFRTVCGNETFSCVICERIPGINKEDFMYITCFNKPASFPGKQPVYLCINDTIAGFGSSSFDISNVFKKEIN